MDGGAGVFTKQTTNRMQNGSSKKNSLFCRMKRGRYIYLLMLPGIVYFVIFKYIPMGMLAIAFQDYNPYVGMRGSEWVGFHHFITLFKDPFFYTMFRNTLAINLLSLIFYFPVPIILALLMNEVAHERYKKFIQTIVYMPHFLSWVIIASMTFFLLSVDVGVINKFLTFLGVDTISFLSKPSAFWPIVIAQTIWKNTGWGTIIFLAAMAGVDISQYEAATIDGAGRLQKIFYITLPAIAPTIITLLILRLGAIADVDFEQLLFMTNSQVYHVAEVFDTYSYRLGIQQGEISFGTCVSMFKGLIGVVFVWISDFTVKKMGYEGIF